MISQGYARSRAVPLTGSGTAPAMFGGTDHSAVRQAWHRLPPQRVHDLLADVALRPTQVA